VAHAKYTARHPPEGVPVAKEHRNSNPMLGNPIQSVQKTTCNRSSDRTNGVVSHQEVIKHKTKGGGNKRRERGKRRSKQLEEMVCNIV
jgi:hypothetical protein